MSVKIIMNLRKNIIQKLREWKILNEEGYADRPKKWNCCEELISPQNLPQHIKDNHMTGYKISF